VCCYVQFTDVSFAQKDIYIYIYIYKVKVKWYRYRPGVAQRVGRGIIVLFHDRGTRRGWVVSSTPCSTLPPGKTRYPFYRRLGGPQGRFERAGNLAPTGFWSRIVQPVFSRYTDWATGPKHTHTHTYIYMCVCVGVYKRMLQNVYSVNGNTFCLGDLFFNTEEEILCL